MTQRLMKQRLRRNKGNKLITLLIILTQSLKEVNHTNAVQCLDVQALFFLQTLRL